MTDGALVAARALAYGALLLAAGLPLYLISAERAIAVTRRLRLIEALLALTAAGASIWLALASVAAMAALPISALDRATVSAVLAATPLGTVLAIRLAALLLVRVAVALRLLVFAIALPAAVALATVAWTGHAGATEAALGTIHRLADVIHLLAAATWLGALAVLLASVCGTTDARDLEARLAGFSTTGSVIVALLVGTGIINTLSITGWPIAPTGTWVLLLGVKLAMFGAMLGLAALNRWRLTPALAAGLPDARSKLRRSLICETALGLGVIAIVAVFGLLDPAG